MDLATAFLNLAKAVEGRRVARKQLTEATELVAAKIVEQGRAGDAVTVGDREYRISRLYFGCSQWSNRTWDRTGKANTLLAVVGNHLYALLDSRDGVHDGSNMHYPRTSFYLSDEPDPDDQIDWATAVIRQRFAQDAGEVVAALAAKYAAEAGMMADSGQAVSKLAVR